MAQTKTLAIFIAATVPTEEEGKETSVMKAAKALGEGVLLESDSSNSIQGNKSEDYYVDEEGNKHKLNSFEHVMFRWGNSDFINKYG